MAKNRPSRKGRPRSAGERYADSQLSRREKARRRKAREAAEKKENQRLAIANRRKHLGVDAELAKNPMSHLVSYRWFHAGLVEPHHVRASQEFAELHYAYLRVMRTPGLPRTGEGGVDTDPQGMDYGYIRKCQRIRSAYDALRDELIRSGLFGVVQHIAVENQDRQQLVEPFRSAMDIVHLQLIGAVSDSGAVG